MTAIDSTPAGSSESLPWDRYRSKVRKLAVERGDEDDDFISGDHVMSESFEDAADFEGQVLNIIGRLDVNVDALLLMWPDWRQRLAFHAPIMIQAGLAGYTSLQIGRWFADAFGFIGKHMITMKYGNPTMASLVNMFASVNWVTVPLFMSGARTDGTTPCPVCLQVRQTLINALTGICVPLVASPMVCFAYGHATGLGRDLPLVSESFHPTKSYRFLKPMYQEVFRNRRLPWLIAANILAAPLVTAAQYYTRERMFFEIVENPAMVQDFTNSTKSRATLWENVKLFGGKIKKKIFD